MLSKTRLQVNAQLSLFIHLYSLVLPKLSLTQTLYMCEQNSFKLHFKYIYFQKNENHI